SGTGLGRYGNFRESGSTTPGGASLDAADYRKKGGRRKFGAGALASGGPRNVGSVIPTRCPPGRWITVESPPGPSSVSVSASDTIPDCGAGTALCLPCEKAENKRRAFPPLLPAPSPARGEGGEAGVGTAQGVLSGLTG